MTVESSSKKSQLSNKNQGRKLTPIKPGRYVLKRSRSAAFGDENGHALIDANQRKYIYKECKENCEVFEVPDNQDGTSCYIIINNIVIDIEGYLLLPIVWMYFYEV